MFDVKLLDTLKLPETLIDKIETISNEWDVNEDEEDDTIEEIIFPLLEKEIIGKVLYLGTWELKNDVYYNRNNYSIIYRILRNHTKTLIFKYHIDRVEFIRNGKYRIVIKPSQSGNGNTYYLPLSTFYKLLKSHIIRDKQFILSFDKEHIKQIMKELVCEIIDRGN